MRYTKDQCEIYVETIDSSRRKIRVVPQNPDIVLSKRECSTSYPLELIELILHINGPYGLCDEILRDEQPDYVQTGLKYGLLSYVSQSAFSRSRILDFGCGSGASTAILGRMFPDADILGLEMNKTLLETARARIAFYAFQHVAFVHSPDPLAIPNGLGAFDYIVLNGVYEHLLPQERKVLLPRLWALLKPGGAMFITETPYRYFPVETHTAGLPFINYLPDRLAHRYAQYFSKRNLRNASWPELLRRGIRGGSVSEVMRILAACRPGNAVLMKPSCLGVNDRIDLWRIQINRSRYPRLKKIFGVCIRLLSYTGITLVPSLYIAVRKRTNDVPPD
ncbi:MAG TPA: class I SAM-dependent methyltransferase [Sedimentisphaerales bacterium]|nr:class I SAM-dependent methyltransferase [Sedimentisphaerales bacterium]